ncbi:MAG: TonB-dependent receptor [Myxococcota bacterium]|nr:TonB-dependent receptor [Myxococcota bacterium]
MFREGRAGISRLLTLLGVLGLLSLYGASGREAAADEATADSKGHSHSVRSQSMDFDEIVITGAPHSRTRFDVIQGTSVLSKEELEGTLMPTLGETLAELPGVSSTYFGPGASRPVIRGLDGPRVRVLQNGLGSLDASVTSPDHAVVTEGLLMERVEIIRGAGTLLFGGSAIGGVVNVDDGRIPLEVPSDYVEGDVRVLYGSAANEKSGSMAITGGVDQWAVRAAGAFAQSDDLQIPGYAVSSALAAEEPGLDRGPYGVASSTETDRRTGTAGASWIGDSSMLGVSYGVMQDDYGVPAEPGEAVAIDLLQKRFDSRGTLGESFLIFDQASFRYGYADYQHKELEGEGPDQELATLFKNKAHEARVDLTQKEFNDLHGTVGFQLLHRDFEASGEEAYVPPNVTTNWGLFAVEEYHWDQFRFEGGLRYEWQQVKSDSIGFERTFNAVSFSAGAGYTFLEDYLVGVSVSRTERAPGPEELLSYGAHLATGGFDIGDASLDKESGWTVEGTIRRKRGRWTGGINMYWTRFSDFIYQENGAFCDPGEDASGRPVCTPNPTGGELQLRTFTQNDVDFWGGEITGAFDFYQSDKYTGLVDVAFDWVNANVRNGPSNTLPRIPPYRVKAGIEGRSDYADLRFEVWWVRAQDRVAQNELPTDSYVMLNLIFTAHPFPKQRNVTLIAQGRNLLNEEARVHSSFLKDKLPLPGREARLSLSVAF